MEGELISARQASDEAARKVWLDYIGKLNDRHRQSIGSSGATSWVLFGALVAILLSTIPRLTSFLKNPANLSSALVCFAFEFDVAIMLLAAYSYLLYFHLGGMATRTVPDRSRRVQPIIHVGVMMMQLFLIFSHFLAAKSAPVGPKSLRWGLAGVGLFWAVNLYMLVRKDTHKFRQSRQLGIPIPWFQGAGIDPQLGAPIGFGICASLTGLFLAGLIWYISLQMRAGEDWLAPLDASCSVLVFLVILVALAYRGFKVTLADSYEVLERSILLENLSPSDIRAKFIAQFIGSSAAEWLKDQIASLKEADDALLRVHAEIHRALDELEARGDRASREFKAALVKALSTLGMGVHQHAQVLKRHHFLTMEFSKALAGEPLSPPLTIVMSEWKAQLGQMVATARSATELRVKLIAISRSISAKK
ncbi:MAG: hypothetical protein LAO19_20485 [Acidobacteriia bacterium]|nr:hypothetical protein [Terriglobia bacterium]